MRRLLRLTGLLLASVTLLVGCDTSSLPGAPPGDAFGSVTYAPFGTAQMAGDPSEPDFWCRGTVRPDEGGASVPFEIELKFPSSLTKAADGRTREVYFKLTPAEHGGPGAGDLLTATCRLPHAEGLDREEKAERRTGRLLHRERRALGRQRSAASAVQSGHAYSTPAPSRAANVAVSAASNSSDPWADLPACSGEWHLLDWWDNNDGTTTYVIACITEDAGGGPDGDSGNDGAGGGGPAGGQPGDECANPDLMQRPDNCFDTGQYIYTPDDLNLIDQYRDDYLEGLNAAEKALCFPNGGSLHTGALVTEECMRVATASGTALFWAHRFLPNPGDYWHERNSPFDAFKHVLWSAEYTRLIGPIRAKVYADAHETSSASSVETNMDQMNNQYGRHIGVQAPSVTVSSTQGVFTRYFRGEYFPIQVWACPTGNGRQGNRWDCIPMNERPIDWNRLDGGSYTANES